MTIDWDGMIVAFESRSPLITHFFDRESGEVVQCVAEREPARHAELASSLRYVALPKDEGERSSGEMAAFLAEVENERARGELGAALSGAEPAAAFRDALRRDGKEEARFFQFKHRRARERAQAWLTEMQITFEKKAEPLKTARDFPGGAPGGPKPR